MALPETLVDLNDEVRETRGRPGRTRYPSGESLLEKALTPLARGGCRDETRVGHWKGPRQREGPSWRGPPENVATYTGRPSAGVQPPLAGRCLRCYGLERGKARDPLHHDAIRELTPQAANTGSYL